MRVLLIMLSLLLGLRTADCATPSEVLQAAGLTRQDKLWLTANDLRLADRLDALEKIDRRLQESRKQCEIPESLRL